MSASAVRDRVNPDLRVEEVEHAFLEFDARGLMFLDGSLGLALALPGNLGR